MIGESISDLMDARSDEMTGGPRSHEWIVGMNILGLGTDIIEVPRIGKMIEDHGEIFLRRVYTEREIDYCQGRKHAFEHFAGRWAAKEAILKAIGTGWVRGIAWTDMEIRREGNKGPKVFVAGGARDAALDRGIGEILISISHCRTYATATAIALGVNTTKDEEAAGDAFDSPASG